MSAPFDFAGFLAALTNTDDQLETLNELNTVLGALHITERKNVVPDEAFNVIFDCLSSNDEETIIRCCSCLDLLLETLDPKCVLTQYAEFLQQGLEHKAEAVKKLSLDQILRILNQSADLVVCDREILLKVVKLIGDDSIEISRKSEKIITNLATDNKGLLALFQNQILEKFKTVSEKNDVVRFRVYECMINIARISPESLKQCEDCKILQQLVDEINHTDDILLQLNAIELLKDLAACHHGLVFLDRTGVIGHLETLLANIEDNPLTGFLLPGLVKFFGNVAHILPQEVCSRFLTFTTLLFELVDSADLNLKLLAIETVGFIGTTNHGKYALDQVKKMNHVCEVMQSLIYSSGNNAQARILESASSLISLKTADQTPELLIITESWFRAFGPKAMEMLHEMSQKPFTEVRCAALHVLLGLALSPWGQHLLHNSPGFSEYLLNRDTESTKEGKEAKYAIIMTLKDSPSSIEIFGRPYHMRLKQYSNEGPFYVRTEAAVAMEGS